MEKSSKWKPIYQSATNAFLKNLGKDILEEVLFIEAETKTYQWLEK